MNTRAMKERIHAVERYDSVTIREIHDDINRIKVLGARVQLLNLLIERLTPNGQG